jgi:hypothetical protein
LCKMRRRPKVWVDLIGYGLAVYWIGYVSNVRLADLSATMLNLLRIEYHVRILEPSLAGDRFPESQ